MSHFPEDRPRILVVDDEKVIRDMLAEFLGRSGLPLEVFGYAELPADLQLQPALVLKEAPPLPV